MAEVGLWLLLLAVGAAAGIFGDRAWRDEVSDDANESLWARITRARNVCFDLMDRPMPKDRVAAVEWATRIETANAVLAALNPTHQETFGPTV